MKKFLTLLKFEFLVNSPRTKDEGVFARVKKALIAMLGIGLIVLFFVYALSSILNIFIQAEMEHEFLTYFIFLLMIVQFVYGLNAAIKTFYLRTDHSILKLPVGGGTIFGVKFVYLYIKEFLFTLVIALPVLVMFGIKSAQSALYFSLIPLNLLALPIIPYFLAILFSAPALFVVKLFKNKYLIILLFYIAVLTIGFTAYIFALKFILNTLKSSNVYDVFSDATLFKIKQFASYLYLPQLFKNSLLFYRFWRSILINFATMLLLGGCVYLFANGQYLKIILSAAELEERSFKKSTKIVSTSPTRAIVQKEFKNIFRSSNYSFQYFTMVFTTPLMVYFSSEIASNIGVSGLGASVLPGIAVLVLIMFISMGTSFAATSITREGDNFYNTKIIPVRFVSQVWVKFNIHVLVAVPAIFLSCFVLAAAKFISVVQAVLISVAVCIIVAGNIAKSILTDIKRPQFNFLDNGEVASTNKNISSALTVGFVVAVLMGVGSIVVSFFVGVPAMYLVLFGFGLPYAALEMFALFHKLEKRYSAIEV